MTEIGPPKRGRPREDWRSRGVQKTVTLHEGDVRMVDELKEFLGTNSMSDVCRTAIRSFYAQVLGK